MDDDLIPISAVEHYAYCPRQAALIHVEGVWADNTHTALGTAEHSAVDSQTRLVRRQGRDCWLSLPVGSTRLGVRGVCDAVELTPNPLPVEHKPVRSKRHFSPAAQQLAIQAMCLEEMFSTKVGLGVIYAGKQRRRHEVTIDDALRDAAVQTLEGFREMLTTRVLPPRVLDRRCRNCSLQNVCLVDEDGTPLITDVDAGFRPAPEGNW